VIVDPERGPDARPGSAIHEVDPGSRGFRAGIRSGMKIMRINKRYCLNWTTTKVAEAIRRSLDAKGRVSFTLAPTEDYGTTHTQKGVKKAGIDVLPTCWRMFWAGPIPQRAVSLTASLSMACFVIAIVNDNWISIHGDPSALELDSLSVTNGTVMERVDFGVIRCVPRLGFRLLVHNCERRGTFIFNAVVR